MNRNQEKSGPSDDKAENEDTHGKTSDRESAGNQKKSKKQGGDSHTILGDLNDDGDKTGN